MQSEHVFCYTADSASCIQRRWAIRSGLGYLRSATRMPHTPETSSALSHAASARASFTSAQGTPALMLLSQSSEEHPPFLLVPHLHLTQQ